LNRFAALIARLETLNDAAMRATLVEDYLSQTPEPDLRHAQEFLAGRLRLRPVKLALIRGLAETRIDPVLFDLAQAYVGDIAETLALTWVPDRRANRDPSLGEIVEALTTLGRSELPKRIESWLDACDETGRWALIKLITGALRTELVREVAVDAPAAQDELFRSSKKDTAGTITAILLYAERINARARVSPLRCTFGVWNGDRLTPIAHCDVSGTDAESIEHFMAENTTSRFGPVREVRHDRDVALVVELSFAAIAETPRRKSGVTLRAPQLQRVRPEAKPTDAATLAALEVRLRSP
jgi:ATP-dependent DNA ligase